MIETPDSNSKGKTNINPSKIKSKFGRGSIIRECINPYPIGSCCGAGSNGGSGAATKITMKYSNN